jgi:pyruvate kinase
MDKPIEKLRTWIKAERGRLTTLAAGLEITPGAINQWDEVPAERMGHVSRLTGIPLTELRPDIFKAAEAAK